jgi:hypothetical protein
VSVGRAVERIEKERLEVRSQANLAIMTGPAVRGENERSVCPGNGADVHHYILDVFIHGELV